MSIPKHNDQRRSVIMIGTWQSKPEDVVNAVEYALKEGGYRHIDGAWFVQRHDILW